MKSKIKILILCFITQIAISQTRKEWSGKVVRDSSSVENVIVYNTSTKKEQLPILKEFLNFRRCPAIPYHFQVWQLIQDG